MNANWLILVYFLLLADSLVVAAGKRETRDEARQVKYSLGMTHLQGSQLDPITQFSTSLLYRPSPQLNLSISQSMTKNYFIDDDADVFNLNDTLLSLTWLPKVRNRKFGLFATIASTVPISERSKRNGLYTVTSLMGGVSYQATKSLGLGGSLGLSYQFNEYDAEPGASLGQGTALPHFNIFIAQNAQFKLIENLFLVYSLTFTETHYHQIKEEAINSLEQNIADQAYQLTVSFSYQINPVFITIGYIQGTMVGLSGVRDYVLFDEERSIGFVSAILNL